MRRTITVSTFTLIALLSNVVFASDSERDYSYEKDSDSSYSGSWGSYSGSTTTTSTTSTSPSKPGALIIDNSMGIPGSFGIVTNMRTGIDDDDNVASAQECENESETLKRTCNSFELEGGSDLQIIQRNQSGALTIESGVFNQNATSYSNFGKSTQARLFDENNHLFDIDKFRFAAKELRKVNTNLPAFTYGTITWQQFVENIAYARTMYGLVRVEIPLQRLSDSTTTETRYRSRSGKRYGFCGKTKTSTCGCGPGIKREGGSEEDYETTDIEPGKTVCGVKIPSFAKIDVRGAILFDWVDCETRQPIQLADLPIEAEDLTVEFSVPVNINPALPDSEGNMKNIMEIAALSEGQTCGPTSSCSFPFQIGDDKFALTPPAKYSRFDVAFDQATFSQLSHPMRYAALMPSGYVAGWEDAFQKLGVTGQLWRSFSLQTPTDDHSIVSANDIKATGVNGPAFEDIPAYMYTGGLIKLEHNINISGLLYIPQAFDLEQEGIELEKRVKRYDEEYESRDSKYSNYTYFDRNYSSDEEYHEHEYQGCPKQTEHYEVTIPSKQYISGAIVVRDGFSIEVEDEGGATIISNDPTVYDSMRATGGGSIVKGFRPFKKTPEGDGSDTTGGTDSNTGSGDGSGSGTGGGTTTGGGSTTGGNPQDNNRPNIPLWMEIKPR